MELKIDVIRNVISDKWIHGCPMCGGRHWSVDEKIIMTPIQLNADRSYKFDGKIVPIVPVMCVNCGNTVLINPLVVDAIDKLDDGFEEEESGNSKQ